MLYIFNPLSRIQIESFNDAMYISIAMYVGFSYAFELDYSSSRRIEIDLRLG